MGFILSILCFLGFVYAACAWLKISKPLAPVFSSSFIGLALFGFALSDRLYPGSVVLIVSGCVFSGIGLFRAWQKKEFSRMFSPVNLALLLLFLVSFVIAQGMTFTVVDDYVYWGIIGKYLYLNHHLPTADTAIIARHLAYTPGTSIFHYFFYTMFGKYSPSISYFAQNIILISALFVVIKKEAFKKSVMTLCMLIVLLTLFSGSIFTKLQVDYLLSVYFFSILWVYFQKKATLLNVFAISLPLCFLFLIKEVGFLLGMFLLLIIFCDLCLYRDIEKKEKLKTILFVIFVGAVLFLLKFAWNGHCQAMGFLKFNSAVNLDSIRQSLSIFADDQVRNGFFIFMKDIIIGPSDRLNLPYLFWYCLVIFCWVKIFQKKKRNDTARFSRMIKISSLCFVIYLLMLYFMQIIIFNVGRSYDHSVGLDRYMNILFSPMVFYTLLLYGECCFLKSEISGKKVMVFALITLSVLGFSRLETSLHRDPHDIQAQNLAQKISQNIDPASQKKIGVIPGINDNHLGIKLLYHLLPHRVDPYSFPTANKEIFLSKLSEYDYIVVDQPAEKTGKWIAALTHADGFEPRLYNPGFYRIDKARENQTIELKKIFEMGQNKK